MAKRRKTKIVLSANRRMNSRAGIVPAGQSSEVEIAAMAAGIRFSGPLPPPEFLKKFDEAVPGSAAEIVRMAHRQSEHRMELERAVILGDNRRATMGMCIGGALATFIVACGTWLISTGHDWAGSILVGVDLIGLVTVFVTGTVSRRKEREKKAGMQARIQEGRKGFV